MTNTRSATSALETFPATSSDLETIPVSHKREYHSVKYCVNVVVVTKDGSDIRHVNYPFQVSSNSSGVYGI